MFKFNKNLYERVGDPEIRYPLFNEFNLLLDECIFKLDDILHELTTKYSKTLDKH